MDVVPSTGRFGFFVSEFRYLMMDAHPPWVADVYSRKENMKSKILLFVLLLPVIQSCEVRNPAEDDYLYPEILDITAPETVALQGSPVYYLYATVKDPQGQEDILRVGFRVSEDQVFSSMADNGAEGDLIPGDGIYTGRILPGLLNAQSGFFRFQVLAEDLAGHTMEALSDTVLAEDALPGDPPNLLESNVPDTVTQEELAGFFIRIRAADSQGTDHIDSLVYQIYPPLAARPLYTGLLTDGGTGGDETAGDGIFSTVVDLADTLKGLGEHLIRFQAWDDGRASLPLVDRFYIYRENDPPSLIHLVAPDSVNRLTSEPIMISVTAEDPQGGQDIRRVFFNSVKPDGNPSAGNPFMLFDDGTSGDLQANDQIYSILLRIEAQNAVGDYIFTFYAEDLSGALSAPLAHQIHVYHEEIN